MKTPEEFLKTAYGQFEKMRGVRVWDSCPECRTGIMEPLGYIELSEKTLQINYGRDSPATEPAINILICSKEVCSCVRFVGSPGSLRIAKELRRIAQ